MEKISSLVRLIDVTPLRSSQLGYSSWLLRCADPAGGSPFTLVASLGRQPELARLLGKLVLVESDAHLRTTVRPCPKVAR